MDMECRSVIFVWSDEMILYLYDALLWIDGGMAFLKQAFSRFWLLYVLSVDGGNGIGEVALCR